MKFCHLALARCRTCVIFILLGVNPAWAQDLIDPQEVTIVRDTFGVPHIYSATDAGCAYGLAWAHAEDDFHTIQTPLLMARARMGEVTGRDGAIADYFTRFIRAREVADTALQNVSPDFRAVLEGYCQGINAFAAAHPKEVRLRKLFPVTPKDILAGYAVTTAGMVGVPFALRAILEGSPASTDSRQTAVPMAPQTTVPRFRQRAPTAWHWPRKSLQTAKRTCWSIRTCPLPARNPCTRRIFPVARAGR